MLLKEQIKNAAEPGKDLSDRCGGWGGGVVCVAYVGRAVCGHGLVECGCVLCWVGGFLWVWLLVTESIGQVLVVAVNSD